MNRNQLTAIHSVLSDVQELSDVGQIEILALRLEKPSDGRDCLSLSLEVATSCHIHVMPGMTSVVRTDAGMSFLFEFWPKA